MARPAISLDHVLIGVEDLETASGALANLLGRAPSWRGRHPTYGTANVLFRLDNAYLELLAPDPNATTDTAWTGSLGRFLRERGGGLFSVALQTSDVGATVEAARGSGLRVEDPAEGEGIDLDTNARREWTNARIPPEATRGTRTFFIQHRSPAGALPMSEMTVSDRSLAVTDVLAASIESRDVRGARSMWRDVFGLPEAKDGEGWRYDLGNAALLLSDGLVEEDQPDRWALVVCRVGDPAGAAARLGVDYEEAEFWGRAGILATVAGASFFLTESL